MDKKNFIFKPNLYKEYFVNFAGTDKNLFGLLGYISETEVCIVHKGMKVDPEIKSISGFVKKRAQEEKFSFIGAPTSIEHKSHKERNYTFIWLKFENPIQISENLIAIEMANFNDED
jgi:hypothetical protein